MVIDMNEAQVRTLEQVRQVVAGTQALEFRRTEDDAGRYAWIASVLRRFEYGRLKRPDRGTMLVYLQRFSGLQPRRRSSGWWRHGWEAIRWSSATATRGCASRCAARPWPMPTKHATGASMPSKLHAETANTLTFSSTR